nr:DUF952 domain-containing protein [Actinomadura sp. CNU-125]
MADSDTAPAQRTLLHIAERRHWESARDAGVSYAMSTLGRTLDDEGFVHCSSDMDQVRGVLDRFYTGVDRDALVILVIDASRLDAPSATSPRGTSCSRTSTARSRSTR